MIPHLLGGRKFAAALDRWLTSPFRRKHYRGVLDVEAIEWAIHWLANHPDVKSNPNSLMWLDRLRANLKHYERECVAKLKQGEKSAG